MIDTIKKKKLKNNNEYELCDFCQEKSDHLTYLNICDKCFKKYYDN